MIIIAGVALAFGSMFCFASSRAFISKPLMTLDPGVLTYITLAVGTAEVFLVMIYFGQLSFLLQITLPILAIFAAVGILHYVVSRLFGYAAIRNIGSNQVASITTLQVVFASVPAILFLRETITFNEIIGSVLVVGGVGLLQATIAARKRGGDPRKGYIAALITAMIYGVTTDMISLGLGSYQYFLPATFIAYLAASVIFVPLIRPSRVFSDLKRFPRSTIWLILAAGVTTVTAQILQFGALNVTPVVVVSPIIATSPVLVVLMTRIIARDIEVFHGRTVAGILLAVLGAILVSLPGI